MTELAHHNVKGGVSERQRLRIAFAKIDFYLRDTCVLSRTLEQLRNDVDADNVAHERRQGQRERSRAGACVERVLVSARRDEGPHLLAHQLDLPLRMLDDEPGCRRLRSDVVVTSPSARSLAEHRVEFGVESDLPYLLCAATCGSDFGSPFQRFLA